MLSQLVDDFRSRIKSTHRQPRFATLTPREKEILKFLAEGQSVKEIALHLNLSVKTVGAPQVQLDAQARHSQQGAVGAVRDSEEDHQDSNRALTQRSGVARASRLAGPPILAGLLSTDD